MVRVLCGRLGCRGSFVFQGVLGFHLLALHWKGVLFLILRNCEFFGQNHR